MGKFKKECDRTDELLLEKLNAVVELRSEVMVDENAEDSDKSLTVDEEITSAESSDASVKSNEEAVENEQSAENEDSADDKEETAGQQESFPGSSAIIRYISFFNIIFAFRSSLLPLPYMVRFIIFNLLFVPSTNPLLRLEATAFSTASMSLINPLAKDLISGIWLLL